MAQNQYSLGAQQRLVKSQPQTANAPAPNLPRPLASPAPSMAPRAMPSVQNMNGAYGPRMLPQSDFMQGRASVRAPYSALFQNRQAPLVRPAQAAPAPPTPQQVSQALGQRRQMQQRANARQFAGMTPQQVSRAMSPRATARAAASQGVTPQQISRVTGAQRQRQQRATARKLAGATPQQVSRAVGQQSRRNARMEARKRARQFAGMTPQQISARLRKK